MCDSVIEVTSPVNRSLKRVAGGVLGCLSLGDNPRSVCQLVFALYVWHTLKHGGICCKRV